MTTSVTAAAIPGALAGVPGGTSTSMSKSSGMTVTGISMITVPATTGVRTRRKSDSREASPNWKREETRTSVASSAGPPSAIAVMHTAMNAPDVPISRTYPAPIRPKRTAWLRVLTPLIATDAKTAQDTNDSGPPAARITIAGVRTMPATQSTASWNPRPSERSGGGLSPGS